MLLEKSVTDRLLSGYVEDPDSGCWIWQGTPGTNGRGKISHGKRWLSASRVAYQHFRGEIPDGLFVLHTCDVPMCVNPDHLFCGSHKDNMRDRSAKGRNGRGGGGGAKLTEAQVQEMVALRRMGHSIRGLSKRFSLATASVRLRLKKAGVYP